MTRRDFLVASAALGSNLRLNLEAEQQRGQSTSLTLEDDKVRAEFDVSSGALTRLKYKETGWLIQNRPELAVPFRLHAPLPSRRANFVLGQKQQATKIAREAANRIRIEWENLLSEHGGRLPIRVAAVVTLQDGCLRFDASIVNDSGLVIESIEYPWLGDLAAPTPDAPMWRRHMWYANLERHELHPHFGQEYGYWGVDYPTQSADSSASLFCLVQSEGQGLYIDFHDPSLRYFGQFVFDQRPGPVESIGSRAPNDPIADAPAHIEARVTHFVFAGPKSSIDLIPVTLRPYSGDWQAGLDIYKEWRATWFKPAAIPEWAQDIHSWLQLQINSPEEEFRIPYAELSDVGRECAEHGVKAIQLVGWNHGGQDRDNPSQDTDPGLGTWQELRDAIAAIQALGVKVVLFGKFVWADKTTEAYRRELRHYAVVDPYGEPYEHGGYRYCTPTQLAGINVRRFAPMCPCCAGYRNVAAKEFAKVVALGAEGFLFDEVCHHGPAKLCFAADHGHPVPAYVYEGDRALFEALSSERPLGRDFFFSGEAPGEVLLQHYPLSYFRIGDDATPVCRYIDPRAPLMVAVTGYDDREMLNRILMYRYIISYEPLCFKGRPGDFPLTLAYGKKIDELRRRYRAFLWDAEFRDTLGAEVTSGGKPHRLYSVFRASSGKRAVVVVNQEFSSEVSLTVTLQGDTGLSVATPEDPEARPTTGELSVPPRSAAIVMEQQPTFEAGRDNRRHECL